MISVRIFSRLTISMTSVFYEIAHDILMDTLACYVTDNIVHFNHSYTQQIISFLK